MSSDQPTAYAWAPTRGGRKLAHGLGQPPIQLRVVEAGDSDGSQPSGSSSATPVQTPDDTPIRPPRAIRGKILVGCMNIIAVSCLLHIVYWMQQTPTPLKFLMMHSVAQFEGFIRQQSHVNINACEHRWCILTQIEAIKRACVEMSSHRCNLAGWFVSAKKFAICQFQFLYLIKTCK